MEFIFKKIQISFNTVAYAPGGILSVFLPRDTDFFKVNTGFLVC